MLRAQADKPEWIDNVRYKNDVGRAINGRDEMQIGSEWALIKKRIDLSEDS